MSEFRDAVRDVISDRECGTAELCRNLRNGRRFAGEIQEIEDAELNVEMGRDARERVLMFVSDRARAAEILPQQQIEIPLYGQLTKFTVLRRKDNPASPQVEFGLMKWTDKDS